MKRKHKIYSRPKRPFDKVRIDEEAKIKEEFGLKNLATGEQQKVDFATLVTLLQ